MGSRARVRTDVSSPPGRRGNTVLRLVRLQGPVGIWGGCLGHRGFRLERRVPYTATQLAPAEFGFWVAAGRADQPDFISFSPATLWFGVNLLWL